MSFIVIPPKAAPAANAVEPGKLLLSARESPLKHGWLIVLQLGCEIARKLGLSTSETCGLELAWGDSVHAGKLRLRAATPGGDIWKGRVSKKDKSVKVTTGALPPGFQPREIKRLSIPYEILNEVRGGVPYLVATLPDGLVKFEED